MIAAGVCALAVGAFTVVAPAGATPPTGPPPPQQTVAALLHKTATPIPTPPAAPVAPQTAAPVPAPAAAPVAPKTAAPPTPTPAAAPAPTPVAAPVLTVSPAVSLRSETTVTVSGSGYKPNYDLYLAQTIDRPVIGFPLVYANEAKLTTDASGSFSTTLTVSPTFKNVDCRTDRCFVATFAAFPNIFLDRTQDVWRPVTFSATATVAPAPAPAPAAPSSGKPTVHISKTKSLASAGEKLHISGTGFSGAGAGIYVGIAPINRYSPFNADSFGATEWIRANDIRGGAWATDLEVAAVFGSTDCHQTQCAIYTLAAHGSPDRTQDTRTLVSFAPAAPGAAAPRPQAPGASTPAAPAAPAAPAQAPSAPSGSPHVTVSKTSGLRSAGDSVTVSGTGFSGAGAGIYVGIASTARFSPTDQSAFGPDTVFIRSAQMSGGAWSTTLRLSATFGTTDCTRTACAIYTLAAHGSSDRSQDTATPVSFVGAARPVAAATTTTTAGAPHGTPKVKVSQSSGLTDGSTITISGTGFSGQAPGIYVGLVPDSTFSTTNADVWGATTYLVPSKIVKGAWSTQLTLHPRIGNIDCTKLACSIRTVMAHGSSDRSQDTKTPVSFAAAGTKPTATTAAASETPALAAGSDQTDPSSNTVIPWTIGGVAAVVVIAALATLVVRRRS